MKLLISLVFATAVAMQLHAQIDTSKKTKVIKDQPVKTMVNNNAAAKQLMKPTGMQLPDLKFAAFTVTATSYNDNGTIKYNVAISCTIKNEGNTAVLTDDIRLQGYTTNDYWYPSRQAFNPAMTGIFRAGCFTSVSNIPGKGETLAAGAAKQISFSCSGLSLTKDPKSVYILVLDELNTIKESDETNNLASMTILL